MMRKGRCAKCGGRNIRAVEGERWEPLVLVRCQECMWQWHTRAPFARALMKEGE